MKTSTPKPPSVRGLERLLAVLAALACLFITVAIWRDVSARQAMWPLPGLYFIELPAVGILAALAFLTGSRYTSRITWAAAGIYVAFGLLGAFSVGLCYAPIAIMFIMLAVLVMVRQEEPFLQTFVPFVMAAIAQASLMLLAIRVLAGAQQGRGGMGYLERYLQGEHEQAWAELQALEAAVRDEPVYSEARALAEETMRRVRRNCERLIERLQAMDYKLGTYPDGLHSEILPPAYAPPDDGSRGDTQTLEAAVGPLPISLVAFWEQVGSVSLIGMHAGWPTSLDPLFVDPPAAGVSELDDMEIQLEIRGHFEPSLAPDVFHKDNVSGGSAYAVKLPDAAMDFLFRNEPHGLLFVPYLRLAILRYGGFPGLEGRSAEFKPLARLIEGLEPF